MSDESPHHVQSRGTLSTTDHATDRLGMTYVYSVISRRAHGVSLGVNLNPNHACNFRCAYCQVEHLTRGKGPAIDRARLLHELNELVDDVLDGDFLARAAPEGARQLVSLAFSGDGEPTSSPDFEGVVTDVNGVVARIRERVPLRYVLITNASLLHLPAVARGLDALRRGGGEAWCKLDAGTDADQRRINDTPVGVEKTVDNIIACARRVPTYIQTFWGRWDGALPTDDEVAAYVAAVRRVVDAHAPIRGVLFYTLARPSLQPEAARLAALSKDELEAIAARVRALGVGVECSV